jgi:hypothetical protein
MDDSGKPMRKKEKQRLKNYSSIASNPGMMVIACYR